VKRGTPEHPKTRGLARTLNLPLPYAAGILEMVFHFTQKYARQGNIGKFSNEQIAEAIHYPDDPDQLIDALILNGWLTPHKIHRLILHDWHDHADDATKKTLRNRNEEFLTIKNRNDNIPDYDYKFKVFEKRMASHSHSHSHSLSLPDSEESDKALSLVDSVPPSTPPLPDPPKPTTARVHTPYTQATEAFFTYMENHHPKELEKIPKLKYMERIESIFKKAIKRRETNETELYNTITNLGNPLKDLFWRNQVRSPTALFGLCKDGSRRFQRILQEVNSTSTQDSFDPLFGDPSLTSLDDLPPDIQNHIRNGKVNAVSLPIKEP
jgi:hypothetical protein